LDPNFSSSILFLSAHSEEQGSLGVILNRPIGQTLGELDSSFLTKPFKLYFGIDLEKAETLKKENSSIEVACFLGHSGWSPGQLEEELERESWLVSALDHELFSQMKQKKEIWKKTVGSISDELKLLVDCPENPMNN
jgi:putative transcriptional regulator